MSEQEAHVQHFPYHVCIGDGSDPRVNYALPLRAFVAMIGPCSVCERVDCLTNFQEWLVEVTQSLMGQHGMVVLYTALLHRLGGQVEFTPEEIQNAVRIHQEYNIRKVVDGDGKVAHELVKPEDTYKPREETEEWQTLLE